MKAVRIIMDEKAKADRGANAYCKKLGLDFQREGIEWMISSQSPYMLSCENKPFIHVQPSDHPTVVCEHNLDVDTTAKELINIVMGCYTVQGVSKVHVIGRGDIGGYVYRELSKCNTVFSTTMTSSSDHPEDVQACIDKADIIVSCAPFGMKLSYEVSDKTILDAGKNFNDLRFDAGRYIDAGTIGTMSLQHIIRNYKELYNVESEA